MNERIEARIMDAARYIIATGATVRGCAKEFGVSKTTIHKDIRERLHEIHPGLAAEAGEVLDRNKAERHLRGGEATRQKYASRE